MSQRSFFLLPYEDGSTVAIDYSKKTNKPEVYQIPYVGRSSDAGGEEAVEEFINFFPEEASLKVGLVEEMLRSAPPWVAMESPELWYQELCTMAAAGISKQKESRTSEQTVVLEWLFYALAAPKISEVHQSCFRTLLDLAGEVVPLPSKVFLLEYSESRTNDVSYGFMAVEPPDVIPLMYLFSEAGLGRCFASSLGLAIRHLGGTGFNLWGRTSPRYNCVLMLEFLSHPGVVPIEELKERSSCSGLLQIQGLLRVADPSQARVLAILLFEKVGGERPAYRTSSCIIAGVWIVMAIHAVYSLYLLRKRV